MPDFSLATCIALGAAIIAVAVLHASEAHNGAKIDAIGVDSTSAFDLYPYRVPQALFDFAPESVVIGMVLERPHLVSSGRSIIDYIANSTSLSDFYTYLAARCAVDEVNERLALDPIFGPANTTFYLNTVLSADNHVRSVWAADAFFEAGVPAVIGPGTVLGGLLIAADYGYLNRTYLTGTNTLNQLNEQSAYGPVLRTIPNDSDVTTLLAQTITQLGWSLVSFIYTDDEYGTSGGTSFLSAASKYNLNITCQYKMPLVEDPIGLREHAQCIADSDANVSVMWMSYPESVNVIATYYKTPGLEDLTLAVSDQIAQFFPLHQAIALYTETAPSYIAKYIHGSISAIPDVGNVASYTKCVESINPGDVDFPDFTTLWELLFSCAYTGPVSATNSNDPNSPYFNPNFLLPPCSDDVKTRTAGTCQCTGGESLASSFIDAKTSYVYDTVQAIANALQEMNYNCTGVLERVPGFAGTDFCDARVWNSSDLEQVIRFSEFYGKSGVVGFDRNSPKCTTAIGQCSALTAYSA